MAVRVLNAETVIQEAVLENGQKIRMHLHFGEKVIVPDHWDLAPGGINYLREEELMSFGPGAGYGALGPVMQDRSRSNHSMQREVVKAKQAKAFEAIRSDDAVRITRQARRASINNAVALATFIAALGLLCWAAWEALS